MSFDEWKWRMMVPETDLMVEASELEDDEEEMAVPLLDTPPAVVEEYEL